MKWRENIININIRNEDKWYVVMSQWNMREVMKWKREEEIMTMKY